jgi:hypothetical protein
MKAVSALVVTAFRLKQEDDLSSSLSLSILDFDLKCQDLTIILNGILMIAPTLFHLYL